MHLLAIDIGIVNLGLVSVWCSEDGSEVRVESARRIDITKFRHRRVPASECRLHHDSFTCDYVSHLVQEEAPLFEAADRVLIERQPIQGITDVFHCLLMHIPRGKVVVMSPNAIHKRYAMSVDYEVRKRQSVSMMYDAYEIPSETTEAFQDRLHDIGDCFLLVRFFCDGLKSAAKNNRARVPFESFRFMPLAAHAGS